MKVFLLGGTKDSINLIKHIKENYTSYILTTTTTEYGSKLAKEGGSDDTIARPLLKEEIIEILKEEKFDILIDATHPFAEHITQTSTSIAKELKIPYIRFERPTINFENIGTKNILPVNTFDDAGKLIEKKFKTGNVLHFAGANTMKHITKYVSVERFYPRILKVPSSIEKCEKLGIDKNHIIPMTGVASCEENIELIEKYNASVMITKESGEIGGIIDKIDAANKKDISVILIQRPVIKELEKKDIITNLDEFDIKIKKILNKNS